MKIAPIQSAINDCLLWQSQRASAVFKSQPADFIVNERLDWDFRGSGEHLFLHIEKTNSNTQWLAKQLAKFYQVPPRDIGYSGLKDRHAVTRQYFSVRLPGIKPGAYALPEHDDYRVIAHVLHDKKLKRGNHRYNDFIIRLRQVQGDAAIIDSRLAYIRTNGCPNFFDSQRFGHDENNLRRAVAWINGETEVRKGHEKSLLLSALRAAVFNQQLAGRVAQQTWHTVLAGDTVVLDGSNSYFIAEQVDKTLQRRAQEKDIHPAGRLIGAESGWVKDKPALQVLLRRQHVSEGYRPLRLVLPILTWQRQADDYIVTMRLPSGAYASGVLRHIFTW